MALVSRPASILASQPTQHRIARQAVDLNVVGVGPVYGDRRHRVADQLRTQLFELRAMMDYVRQKGWAMTEAEPTPTPDCRQTLPTPEASIIRPDTVRFVPGWLPPGQA